MAADILLLIVLIFLVLVVLSLSVRVAIHGGTSRHKDLRACPRSNSEQLAIKYLEEITGRAFPTVNPSWLRWRGRTLELDGYNEELALALEFSGPLHTKWSPNFEPYEKYFARIVKDVVKIKLCAKNAVRLIVVDMSLPAHHWRNYLLSRLHDYGAVVDRPAFYILEQRAEPYRNPSLEASLGLQHLMDEALSLS